MRHLVASLLCITMLVLMVGIFGLVMGGTYSDFAVGRPFDPSKLTAMFSPLIYRKLLVAFIFAMGFAVLDIHALASNSSKASNTSNTPKARPLGFVAVRARRYCLPIVVLLYLGLAERLIREHKGNETFMNSVGSYLFVFLFGVARRPLDASLNQAWDAIKEGIDAFLKPLAERGR